MKKRMLSLLCVLALCLGLLPVTALAAGEDAPNTLYVGNQNVKSGEDTTYWSTNQDTGELTPCTGSGDDWNVKYEQWNSQENRTPSRPDHAAGAHCAKQTRLTSGGRLSSFAVLRRRRL